MHSMRRRAAVVIAAALGVVALTAGLVSAASAGSEAQSAKGGTYRVGWESTFGWSDSFDPTGEYLANFIAIYTNLLGRNLVGYNHVVGTAGGVPVPDLATAIPKPTNGGKTWTFRLKSGIRFGPPVNREITSSDIKYALERLADPKNGGQYAFYFNVIRGFEAVGKGEAQSVSGIRTPNAKTIVFNLTKPAGDFPQRLGMPAAGPIPHEVADCFKGKPGEYGRFVIASGPYMIEGSQNLDIKSCDAMKPISGYDGKTSLVLVRNPTYNARTDSPKARENNPDRFVFRRWIAGDGSSCWRGWSPGPGVGASRNCPRCRSIPFSRPWSVREMAVRFCAKRRQVCNGARAQLAMRNGPGFGSVICWSRPASSRTRSRWCLKARIAEPSPTIRRPCTFRAAFRWRRRSIPTR